MAVLGNTFFETRVEQLFDLAQLVEKIFSAADLEYRVIGGLAVYLYVEDAEPDAARLTRDIDIVVRRQDLARIAEAARRFGLEHRHVAGIDMLVQTGEASARRAVRLVFASNFTGGRTLHDVRLLSLADLVRMKLISFRAKDDAHLKDLDQVGLITPEIEERFPDVLRERLHQMRIRNSDFSA